MLSGTSGRSADTADGAQRQYDPDNFFRMNANIPPST